MNLPCPEVNARFAASRAKPIADAGPIGNVGRAIPDTYYQGGWGVL